MQNGNAWKTIRIPNHLRKVTSGATCQASHLCYNAYKRRSQQAKAFKPLISVAPDRLIAGTADGVKPVKDTWKTKRLQGRPATEEHMRRMIDDETDAEMKQAYAEMLQGSREHPHERLWYTAWILTLRDGAVIGDLCFKGPPAAGEVEIGYGLAPEYWGQGYATEAVQAAVAWAFRQPDVWTVWAETLSDNIASQKVLAKVGFYPNGTGKEGPRFQKGKPASRRMLFFLLSGLGAGTVVGLATQNMMLAEVVGVSLSLALGTVLGAREKRLRTKAEKSQKSDAKTEAAAEKSK